MPGCSGYSAFLTAKNYETNTGVDLQRPKPDPLGDLKEHAAIYLSPDDFRQSLLHTEGFKLEAMITAKKHVGQREKAERSMGEQLQMTPRHPQMDIATSRTPIQVKVDSKPKDAKLTKQVGGSHSGNKLGHKEKNEMLERASQEATLKASEKMLYLLSSEHRSSLRREEQERFVECQTKAPQTTVHFWVTQRSIKVETTPGQVLERILTKEEFIAPMSEKLEAKTEPDANQKLRYFQFM